MLWSFGPTTYAATSLAAGPVEAPFLAENDAAMKKMMAAMTVKPSGDTELLQNIAVVDSLASAITG